MDYPVIYVETKTQLQELANKLEGLDEFALDLEADVNLHRYGRKLCLAQIWDGECCWLVDITVLDILPLKPLLENPNKIKVMYSASFDASLLADLSDIELKGLFDLQICSSLLGMGKRSLKHFMKELFDVDLEKDLQTSDWFRRPLSSEQIRYASLDVRYLLEARQILLPRLEEAELLEEAWDASARVENSRFQEIAEPHLRVRNSAQLTPYQKIYLEEFFRVRDKIAHTKDLPTYRIMRSYQLLHLTKHPPQKLPDLLKLDFFDEKLIEYADEFMEAAARAQARVLNQNSLIEKEIIELRHLLHKHPELSGKESNSARRIHRFVRNFNPSRTLHNLARTGIGYEFSADQTGKVICLRAKLDALSGKEANDSPWASREKKTVHSHGSDGQSAILAGLASRLYENPVKQGRILLIFEPSSENGYGAQKLLRDKKFPALEITNCFSMQNIPGYPLGSIIIPGAAFSFASKGVIIKIKNNSTAQTDSQNSDFAVACGKIASNIPALCHDPLQNDFASISFIQMGSQNLLHNPQKAEIRFKLSSISDLRLEKLTETALAYIHQVCLEYDLELFHSFTNIFPATSSDPELLEIIKHTALSLGLDVFENSIPLCIPEDFGNFNKTAPLAIFGIGSGINMPPLGSPHYDFPDDLIAPAIDFWMSLLKFLQVV